MCVEQIVPYCHCVPMMDVILHTSSPTNTSIDLTPTCDKLEARTLNEAAYATSTIDSDMRATGENDLKSAGEEETFSLSTSRAQVSFFLCDASTANWPKTVCCQYEGKE